MTVNREQNVSAVSGRGINAFHLKADSISADTAGDRGIVVIADLRHTGDLDRGSYFYSNTLYAFQSNRIAGSDVKLNILSRSSRRRVDVPCH